LSCKSVNLSIILAGKVALINFNLASLHGSSSFSAQALRFRILGAPRGFWLETASGSMLLGLQR
jgi:hypothetical protein